MFRNFQKDKTNPSGIKMCEFIIDKANYTVTEKKMLVGYTGSVSIVKDESGQKFAMKNLASSPRDPSLLDIICEISHPAIAKVVGYSNDARPAIISEYCEKGSLQENLDRISKGKWSDQQKFNIIYGFASAMEKVHSLKISHGNLKPTNLLFDKNFNPKIVDFAISSNAIEQKNAYTPPERFNNSDELTQEGDVYAFAMISYIILTGKLPYNGMTNKLLLAAKVKTDERPPLPDDLPAIYKTVINKCWLTDPNDRITFHEIVTELSNDSQFSADARALQSKYASSTTVQHTPSNIIQGHIKPAPQSGKGRPLSIHEKMAAFQAIGAVMPANYAHKFTKVPNTQQDSELDTQTTSPQEDASQEAAPEAATPQEEIEDSAPPIVRRKGRKRGKRGKRRSRKRPSSTRLEEKESEEELESTSSSENETTNDTTASTPEPQVQVQQVLQAEATPSPAAPPLGQTLQPIPGGMPPPLSSVVAQAPPQNPPQPQKPIGTMPPPLSSTAGQATIQSQPQQSQESLPHASLPPALANKPLPPAHKPKPPPKKQKPKNDKSQEQEYEVEYEYVYESSSDEKSEEKKLPFPVYNPPPPQPEPEQTPQQQQPPPATVQQREIIQPIMPAPSKQQQPITVKIIQPEEYPDPIQYSPANDHNAPSTKNTSISINGSYDSPPTIPRDRRDSRDNSRNSDHKSSRDSRDDQDYESSRSSRNKRNSHDKRGSRDKIDSRDRRDSHDYRDSRNSTSHSSRRHSSRDSGSRRRRDSKDSRRDSRHSKSRRSSRYDHYSSESSDSESNSYDKHRHSSSNSRRYSRHSPDYSRHSQLPIQTSKDVNLIKNLAPAAVSYQISPENNRKKVEIASLGDPELCLLVGKHLIFGTGGFEKDPSKGFAYVELASKYEIEGSLELLGCLYETGVENVTAPQLDRARTFYELSIKKHNSVFSIYRYAMLESDKVRHALLIKRAANAGLPAAMAEYARLLQFGIGIKQNVNKANDFYKRASEKGDVSAMLQLAYNYYGGFGLNCCHYKALELYKSAMDAGSIEGKAMYGSMLLFGLGCIARKKEGLALVKQAYQTGEMAGIGLYGNCLVRLKEDKSKGMKLLKEAADNGHAPSMRYYGIALLHDEDKKTALNYIQKAADNNSIHALKEIGDFFYEGTNVTKNTRIAMEYYEKAGKAGDVESMKRFNNYSVFRSKGNKLKDNEKKKICREKATEGNLYAAVKYGYYIQKKDPESAIEKFKAASSKGFMPAFFALGTAYISGNGIQKDKEEGLKLLKHAISHGCTSDGNSSLLKLFDSFVAINEWRKVLELAKIGLESGEPNCIYYYYYALIETKCGDNDEIADLAMKAAFSDNHDYKAKYAQMLEEGKYMKRDLDLALLFYKEAHDTKNYERLLNQME
ncbi:hypothetical protein TRFO_15021 [Tritrichomonas foetus]|uniref:Protein kinase domain-containing protein n=1 Tax=Tritrichomonas foetus TaxID=1144522 RepID=A0A1J4KTE0_9EUKA|nr:hypothetical protein TRFO_15021 [Tritrichomonas foetus]|eukprot:OHT14515.1 hypothetical protein TRFO_15021 [Tritrichomonas foetus]